MRRRLHWVFCLSCHTVKLYLVATEMKSFRNKNAGYLTIVIPLMRRQLLHNGPTSVAMIYGRHQVLIYSYEYPAEFYFGWPVCHCRSLIASLSLLVCHCQSVIASLSLPVCHCQSVIAGLSLPVSHCQIFSAWSFHIHSTVFITLVVEVVQEICLTDCTQLDWGIAPRFLYSS